MNIDGLKYFDIIERYFDGYMSDFERKNFEELLDADDELKQEYILYQRAVDGVKDFFVDEYKGRLKELDNELDFALVKEDKPKSKRIFLFSLAASLLILIVSGIVVFSYNQEDGLQKIATKYNELDRGLPVLMSSVDNQKLNEAMNLYKQKEYQKSLDILYTLNKQQANNDTLLYYIGVNLQLLNRDKVAVNYFRDIENSTDIEFKEKVQFRLMLCYLKLEDKPNAIELLLKMSKNPQHLYNEKANKILKELE